MMRYYYLSRTFGRMLLNEFRLLPGVNLFKRAFMLARGFESDKYFYYNFKENNPSEYLSDLVRPLTRLINRPYTDILNNKLLFERTLSSLIRVPKNYFLIQSDRVISLDGLSQNNGIDGLLDMLNKKQTLVLKPVVGGWGRGIKILRIKGKHLTWNDLPIKQTELPSIVSDLNNYLVTEYINQHSYSHNIFPDSANSLRLLTMINPDDGNAFIAAALHRFGSSRSKPTDNFSTGGISTQIDINTGVILNAVEKAGKNKFKWIDCHPDTDQQITGIQIPRWEPLKASIINIAQKLPYLPYIGWDIIITDEDFTAIEGNNHSDVVFQIHAPLLRDDRIRNFYKYHKIIS